jgi:hypothetical protein
MAYKNKIIYARVEEGLYDRIKKICRDRGEDVSDFIRRSVLKELATLSFLPPEQKKALGFD